jgi:hypothetical protein
VELGIRGKLGKSNCSIDVITQQFFAECHLAREKAFDSSAKKAFSKGGVTLYARLNRFSEVPRQSHFYSSSFWCFFLFL